MRTGVSRVEQVERNRELVLAAARRVFLAKGYAGATVDAIADEAGFSKGVVYSQFESKADLFLALLDRRIDERAARNEALARAGGDTFASVLELGARLRRDEPEWALLVVEFRAHAARDAVLNERYARAHARTVDRLARLLDGVFERQGVPPAVPSRTAAELVLALASGAVLERTADPDALPVASVVEMMRRAVGLPPKEET